MAENKTSISSDADKNSSQPPSVFGIGWLKEVSEAPTTFYSGLYRGGLSAAAGQLREQADYLRKLSELDQPADALACHGEYMRKVFTNWIEESQRIFNQSIALAARSK